MQNDATELARQVQKIANEIAFGMDAYRQAPKGGMVRSALMGSLVSRMRSLDFAFATLDRQHCKDVAEDCRAVQQTTELVRLCKFGADGTCPYVTHPTIRCHKNSCWLATQTGSQRDWPGADTVLR